MRAATWGKEPERQGRIDPLLWQTGLTRNYCGGGCDFLLIATELSPICAPAHIRTCLWPRAGRWTSGQEAGRSPGMDGGSRKDPPRWTGSNQAIESRATIGSRRRPVSPVLRGGRSLKQRRTGFFGLVGPPKVNTEEACLSLPRVRTGKFPLQTKAASSGEEPIAPSCLHRTIAQCHLSPLTPDVCAFAGSNV